MLHTIDALPPEIAEAVNRARATGQPQSGLVCPECDGGRSREVSVTVWARDQRVCIAHCWRNKCGKTWEVALEGTVKVGDLPPVSQYVRFTATEPLSQDVYDKCWLRWRLSAGTLARYGVAQAVDSHRLAIPIYGPSGVWRGQCLRYFGAGTPRKSKALNEIYPDAVVLGWYRTACTLPTIVVEDFLSAMRLAQIGRSACSLGGVSLSQDKIDELTMHLGSNWMLALDADATSRAIHIAARRGIGIMRLDRDFKDCTNEEIIHAVG